MSGCVIYPAWLFAVPSFLDDFGRCLPVCGIPGSRMRQDNGFGVATNNWISPGSHSLFPDPDGSSEESRAFQAQHCSNHTFLCIKSHRITLIPPSSQEKPHQRGSNQISGNRQVGVTEHSHNCPSDLLPCTQKDHSPLPTS